MYDNREKVGWYRIQFENKEYIGNKGWVRILLFNTKQS